MLKAGFAAITTAAAGSPAGSSSAAGFAVRCSSRAGSRSCSFSTRRLRWRPATGPARCAGGRTTCASVRSGGRCIRRRGSRRDRCHPAPRALGRRHPSAAAAQGRAGRSAGRDVRAARRPALAGGRRTAAALVARRLLGRRAEAGRWACDRYHASLAGGGAQGGLAAAGAAASPLGSRHIVVTTAPVGTVNDPTGSNPCRP